MADQQRQDVAYLSDIEGIAKVPSGAVVGNIPLFGANGVLSDSDKTPADFVDGAALASAVQTAVASSTTEIWDAIKGVDALQAYGASAWAAGTTYAIGDFCRHSADGYDGYMCKEAHTAGQSFDPDKWEGVLTTAGRTAIDALLAGAGAGAATLADIAPDYDSRTYYEAGQLAVNDGVLQVCTTRGLGPAATFSTSGASVANALATTLAQYAKKAELDEKADSAAIDAAYDTSEGGYAVGDTCVHGGKWYKCTAAVSEGDAWDPSDWSETTVKDALSGGVTQVNADWDETDSDSPAYIENKPAIPAIDDTLSEAGKAAEAKAVGEALSALSVGFTKGLSYAIEEIVALDEGDEEYDPAKVTYPLKDRTVNYLDVEIFDNREIRLIPPVASTDDGNVPLARDFYVVFHVTSNQDATVEMPEMKIEDCAGERTTIVVPIGEFVTYRFTDTDKSQSVFLATLFADPALRKVREIERALDDIINDQGGGTFQTGIYLKDDASGLYYRLTAVRDPETGEINVGIDQTGVYGPGGAPSDASDASGDSSSSGED